MFSIRSLAGTALRGLRGTRPDPQLVDPDAEDDVDPEELEALRRDLAGELDRVAAPTSPSSL